MHAGQACASNTRMLIHESLFDEAVANVTAGFQAVPVGNPAAHETLVGPVISAAQKKRCSTPVSKCVVTAPKSPPVEVLSKIYPRIWPTVTT